MKIQGVGGIGHPGMIDSILEMERAPIEGAKQRRDRVTSDRNDFRSFDDMLAKFGKSLEGLKNKSQFEKLTFESSHPDLLDGSLISNAKPGSFEVEVDGLAKPHRQLAFGFPDANKTPVGFGYLRVGVGEDVKDITIDPGATLQDVAAKINDAAVGARAMVINTGHKDDPFRLLVSSVQNGGDAILEVDPDTTFTEFKNQVMPQDLRMKLEGVDIKRGANQLDDLIEGVKLNAKRAEPGTKIQVEIKQDIDRTSDGIKEFATQYNEIAAFIGKQSRIDSQTRKAGNLSGDSTVRSAARKLQNDIGAMRIGSEGLSLADVGITTDPHSGTLKVDDAKLKQALANDYDGVAAVFANSEQGPGLAQRLSNTISQLRDRSHGAIAVRLKSYDQRLQRQEQDITRQEDRVSKKRTQLERTFASLSAKMTGMQQTSSFLNARFSSSETGGDKQPPSDSSGTTATNLG